MSQEDLPIIAEGIAFQALTKANQTERDIIAHEKLCAERYANIHTAIADIKGLLKWVGGTGFTIIIGLLGWSLLQQVDANDAKIEAIRQQQVSQS